MQDTFYLNLYPHKKTASYTGCTCNIQWSNVNRPVRSGSHLLWTSTRTSTCVYSAYFFCALWDVAPKIYFGLSVSISCESLLQLPSVHHLEFAAKRCVRVILFQCPLFKWYVQFPLPWHSCNLSSVNCISHLTAISVPCRLGYPVGKSCFCLSSTVRSYCVGKVVTTIYCS